MVSRLFLPSRGAMAASHWPSGERRIRLNSGFLKKVSTGSFSASASGPSRARARPSANGVLIVCMLLRSSLRSGCPRKGLNCTVWVWGIQQAKALLFCAKDRGRRGAHAPSHVDSGSTPESFNGNTRHKPSKGRTRRQARRVRSPKHIFGRVQKNPVAKRPRDFDLELLVRFRSEWSRCHKGRLPPGCGRRRRTRSLPAHCQTRADPRR